MWIRAFTTKCFRISIGQNNHQECNGNYYDDHSALTLEEAIERCSNLSEAIIKPTFECTWGQGVKLIKAENGMVPLIVL